VTSSAIFSPAAHQTKQGQMEINFSRQHTALMDNQQERVKSWNPASYERFLSSAVVAFQKQYVIVSVEKGSTCGHQQGLSHGQVESIGCLRCLLSTEDDALIDCHQYTLLINLCLDVAV
jgi:hypothetical protein